MSFSILPYKEELSVTDGQILIGNQWCNSSTGESFVQVHPSTNEEVVRIAQASSEDVDRAVRAARQAFDQGPWPKMKARERQRYLLRIADLLEQHSEELSRLQCLDNGVPIKFSMSYRVSGQFAADIFRHFAGWVDKINGEVHPQFTDDMPLQFISMREPVGVVAGIIPWNAPLLQYPNKIAPALATGCTLVMKPSELASLTALRVSELIQQAELPEGVFNVVTGDGRIGDALVRHPGVDKVTFTGSKAVGSHILSLSGEDIKRTTLELGGKSAAIIFPDAPDVKSACQTAMAMGSTFLSGQVCSTTSRVLVHKSIYDDFLQYAQDQVKTIVRGNPFDPEVTSAPMIDKKQLDKVLGYFDIGIQDGARLAFGGGQPGGELAQGNWVEPSVFADVDNNMRIAQEEIFGPILCAIPFETEEEAVSIANDSRFGLSGGVYTSNIGRALRISKALRTGTVGVNGYTFMPNSPFGGFKSSGLGREGGWGAIEAYTEVKTVIINENI